MERRSRSRRLLEPAAPLELRHPGDPFVAEGEEVPRHVRRRLLLGEHRDARGRGWIPEEQRVEVEHVVGGDDDLAVEDAAPGSISAKGFASSGSEASSGLRSRLWVWTFSPS